MVCPDGLECIPHMKGDGHGDSVGQHKREKTLEYFNVI